MSADGPQLWAAKRLLDLAKRQGFTFQRVAPGRMGRCLLAAKPSNTATRSISAGSVTPATPPGPASAH
jgi:hypothetical protein